MQPTYLPWIGYFDLIDMVDVFVLLDNVQFVKQTWQQRNRIRTNNGLEWMTVPVLIKGRFGQLIKDVELKDAIFIDKHLKQITHNYQKAKEYDRYFKEFSELFHRVASTGDLCQFNIEMIKWMCKQFKIKAEFVMASELNIDGKRSEKIINIMKALDADCYISPRGSEGYLVDDYHAFVAGGVSVFYHQFNHPEYSQVYKPFMPFACGIDVLFNEGEQSSEIIRSGRESLIVAGEVVAQ